MCARPARWNRVREEWSPYCSGMTCGNSERICQVCSGPFVLNVGEAGTKYCSVLCKERGYHPTRKASHDRPECVWCRKVADRPSSSRINSAWPYICQECTHPIRQVVHILKAHHVPHERARALALDPSCEVCGTDLLTMQRVGGGVRPVLAVDHDHMCCPADARSCGQCVRGLLCGRCNSAAGLLLDSVESARMMVKYLEAWVNGHTA